MTVATNVPSVSYIEDGTTLALPVPFRFLEPGHLVVTRTVGGVETPLSYPSQWTASGGLSDSGGTVTLAASTAGASLNIVRQTPRSQQTKYDVSGRFPSATHELAIDRLMMVAQEQDAALQAAELAQIPVDVNAAILDNVRSLLFVVTGAGGLGASLNTRFRYDVHLGSFGYPVDSASDVTPALNAAMASGRDVYIPNVAGGLPMLTQPTYPTGRYSLYGDNARSTLKKMYNGGAAFEIRGANQSIRDLVVDFEGLSLGNAGGLIDMRTDLAGIEFCELGDIVTYGATFLLKDRASASNVGTIWRAENIFGRRHRGVGAAVQRQFAFLEWSNLVADFVQMPTLNRAGMVVWDINGNQGGYLNKLETSNVPRPEDAGMIGMRLTNCNATRVTEGLQDGIAGDGYLLAGGCLNVKFFEAASSICSGAAIKIRDTAGVNINIQLHGFNGVGRNNVAGGWSPAASHGIDVASVATSTCVNQLELHGCAFQQFTGSGEYYSRATELGRYGGKSRANTRYGIEAPLAVSGNVASGSTIANGLGDYLLGGAGAASGSFHGRNIWGNGGGLYNFDGVA